MKHRHQNRNKSPRSAALRVRPGFTIVELLVVVAIIIVLASLVFIGMGRIQSTGRSAVCASNLRQVGVAMLSYASDNQGKLPPLAKIDPETGKQLGIWTLVVAREGYLWDNSIPGTPKLGEGNWACPDCRVPANTHGGYGIAEATVMQYDDRVSRANTRLGKSEFGSMRLTSIVNPAQPCLRATQSHRFFLRLCAMPRQASTPLTTWAGSTPVRRMSRPWNFFEKRWWSMPRRWSMVAWKSRTWTTSLTAL